MDGRELVSRLFDLSTRARRLPSPSARKPEAYHEAKDELGHDIEGLAIEVERWLGLARR